MLCQHSTPHVIHSYIFTTDAIVTLLELKLLNDMPSLNASLKLNHISLPSPRYAH